MDFVIARTFRLSSLMVALTSALLFGVLVLVLELSRPAAVSISLGSLIRDFTRDAVLMLRYSWVC